MTADESTLHLFFTEIRMLRPGGEFQIVRGKDWGQVLHPETQYPADDGSNPVGGPSDSFTAAGLCWRLDAEAGDVIRIEFQRTFENDEDKKEISWRKLRNDPLTADDAQEIRKAKFSIAGTWDDWSESHKMTYDESKQHFTFRVMVGETGKLSFMILVGGQWDMVLYPDSDNANPYEDHKMMGPGSNNISNSWTIGSHEEDEFAANQMHDIRLMLKKGQPWKVDWSRA